MELNYLFIPVLSFSIAFLLIPLLRQIAITIQLVDNPNLRKVHNSSVPLVGGIAIFIATLLTLPLVIKSEIKLFDYSNLFASSSILLIMGVIDDKYDIKAILKLMVQLLIAHFTFESGVKIESLHGLFGIYTLTEWTQYILTIITITGIVNAVNLMDGIDGLAAGISIVSFMIFSWLSFVTRNDALFTIFLTLTGATVAFLYFNFNKKQKVFMGDAGSLTIGYILVVCAIKLLQSNSNDILISQVMIGVVLIFLIPVFDALRVFRRRIKSGKSPFTADRTHLHHLILSLGLQHKLAAVLITSLMILIIILGYTFYSILGLSLTIGSMICFFFTISYFLQLNDQIANWKKKIKVMEQK